MTPHTTTGPTQLAVSDLGLHVGQVLGDSAWHVIEQADANTFDAATHDEQWIHIDPHRAAQGPCGRTFTHGYLTLFLATWLVDEVLKAPDRLVYEAQHGMGHRYAGYVPVIIRPSITPRRESLTHGSRGSR